MSKWEYADPNCCRPWEDPTGQARCRRLVEKAENMAKGDTLIQGTSCAGRTIREIQLDEVVDVMREIFRLIDLVEQTEGVRHEQEKMRLEFLKAQANGMCKIIAIMDNPYFPNVDAVKSDVVERYEEQA